MQIIRAIVAGERDPEVLAAFRGIRCHSSIEVIKAALVGNDSAEHFFALTESLDLYDFYQTKIEDCDRKPEAAVSALTVRADGDTPALPKARPTAGRSMRLLAMCGPPSMAFSARTSHRYTDLVRHLPIQSVCFVTKFAGHSQLPDLGMQFADRFCGSSAATVALPPRSKMPAVTLEKWQFPLMNPRLIYAMFGGQLRHRAPLFNGL